MLTKKDVCRLLGMSEKTLGRRMADGTFKFSRVGKGQGAQVRFTYADIGLPQPEPAAVEAPAPAPLPVSCAPVVSEREPEPFVIVNGIAMSPEDGRKHAIRERNRRLVQDYRHRRLTNIKFDVLSGTPEHIARDRIEAECSELLKKWNRGIK